MVSEHYCLLYRPFVSAQSFANDLNSTRSETESSSLKRTGPEIASLLYDTHSSIRSRVSLHCYRAKDVCQEHYSLALFDEITDWHVRDNDGRKPDVMKQSVEDETYSVAPWPRGDVSSTIV